MEMVAGPTIQGLDQHKSSQRSVCNATCEFQTYRVGTIPSSHFSLEKRSYYKLSDTIIQLVLTHFMPRKDLLQQSDSNASIW